jgi:hypothetical protein
LVDCMTGALRRDLNRSTMNIPSEECKHRPQSCDDSALQCESKPDGIFGRDTGFAHPH